MKSSVPPPQPPSYHAVPPYYGALYGNAPYGEPDLHGILSPWKLFRTLLRKWWMVLLSLLVGLSAAGFYLSRAAVYYKAGSLIEMSVRRPRLTDQRALVSSDSDFGFSKTEEIFNTRIEKFKGSRMREMVGQQITADFPDLDPDILDALFENVEFELIRRSFIMRIACVSTRPELAAAMANAYADAAVRFSIEENRQISDHAVAWLIQQADHQKRSLDTLSEKVTTFRETRQFDAMESQRDASLESLKQIGVELTRLENASVLAEMLLESLKHVERLPENAGDLPVSTPERQSIIEAVSAWMKVRKEHDSLLSRYTRQHPEVISKAADIQLYADQVTETIQRALRTAAADAELFKRQTDGLRQRLETLSKAATELESRIVRLQAERETLERERDIADMAYKGLLSRIEEARIAADENTTTVKIVEPARAPSRPFRPRPLLVMVLGCILGLGAGGVMALLVALVEDRFDGTEDMQQTLGSPVLGLVPVSPEQDRKATGTKALSDRFGQSAEAYARIRAKIQLVEDPRPACMLLCSAEPREGKTVTAANLAISFARTGMHTLLVDFDMRRPQLRAVFGLKEQTLCLLDVLGKGNQKDFGTLPVRIPDCPNLSVVVNHAARQFSASEIIGSKITAEFVSWARSNYDLVILDAPPFGVSDALRLGGLVDGTLFVHRPGTSRRHALRHAIDEFTSAGNRVLGVVVNGVRFNRPAAFSNYHYDGVRYPRYAKDEQARES